MDADEFRIRGKEMVDYIADYLENIRDRRVYPDVAPGYLHKLLPETAPETGESWQDIFKDVDRAIMPGVLNWQSPHMHAYFPALTSYPSILGEMLASGLNNLTFTWASSPAGTELETIAMNWLGKMIGLPDVFLNVTNESLGGGVIQTTASEATLVSLLAARTRSLLELAELNPEVEPAELSGHLIAYCSDQAHSSVEKAGLIGLVRMRYVESDDKQCMRGPKLEEAILKDKEKGMVPFWVCATLGTTGSVAFDNLEEVTQVCQRHGAWLHCDAAYAGSAFICPEYRHWLKGVENADSLAFNPSKWLMVNFDCTAMWVKDSKALHRTFNVNPIYLRHENSGKAIDYMHWQIPLSRRFRALKLWFVLRSYGVAGLQKHIRESVRLAQKFEALVHADPRFEIPQPRNLGMVVFRLKGDNTLTECLLKRLNARGHIHCVPAIFKSVYVIRFTVTSQMTTSQDIIDDWAEIRNVASRILKEMYGCESGNISLPKKPRVTLKETKYMNKTFGTSLLLANSPMSPKIVNGTYAAIHDYEQVLNSCAHTFSILKMEPKDSPEMRRRIRGIKMVGKKFSLDSCLDMVQGLVAASEERNVQTLPLMTEDEREDLVSNGSSPMDLSSQITSPNSTCPDGHHLFVPPPPSRQYRSKSVDVTLSGLGNNEPTSVTFDMTKNKIIVSPTKDEQTNNDKTIHFGQDVAFCADSDEEITTSVKNVNLESDKVTITGPGSYIKRIIQQFSENSFDCDPEAAKRGENSQSLTKSPSFRERADALCKKCLHFKGKVNK